MKVTITCDNENTVRFLDYLIRTGTYNSRENEMKEWGIDTSDTHLSVTYALDVKPTVDIEFKIEESIPTKQKDSDGKLYLYAARATDTGKLVSDLTSPRRKYWDRESNARAAINSANAHPWFRGRHEHVDLVKFELVEVPVEVKKDVLE